MISRKHLLSAFAVVLFAVSNLSAQKTLDIPPVYQRTPVWCWVTVGEMVFTYYGVANINPAGDFQCGIIALLHPVCDQNCYNCQVPAGNPQRMFNMLTQYPSFASRVSNSSTRITIRAVTSPLTLASLKSEIDAGRPVIAGISPSGYQASGVSQHVALIIGYSKDSLIVNDPFPFGTNAFSGNPYEIAGGREIRSGQFNVTYTAFIHNLRWRDSMFEIACSGSDCENRSVKVSNEPKNEELTQRFPALDFDSMVKSSAREAKTFFVAWRGEEISREKKEFPGTTLNETIYDSKIRMKEWESGSITLTDESIEGKVISKRVNFDATYYLKSREEALKEYQKYVDKLKSALPQWHVLQEREGYINLQEDKRSDSLSVALVVSKLSDGRGMIEFVVNYYEEYPETLPPNSETNKNQKPQPPTSSRGSILVPINSDPAGAEIWVNGKFVGSTPSSIKLAIGNHKIKITRPSYKDWDRDVLINEDETKTITAILVKLP